LNLWPLTTTLLRVAERQSTTALAPYRPQPSGLVAGEGIPKTQGLTCSYAHSAACTQSN
jgi:hypothetical protein